MSPHRFGLFLLCVPSVALSAQAPSAPPAGVTPAQRGPRIVERSQDRLTIDLPTAQSVLVFGMSMYGDMMLLYPPAGVAQPVPAGRHTLALDQSAPWIVGGGKTASASSSGQPRRHCVGDGSLLFEIKRMQSPTILTTPCTWLPDPPDVTWTGPTLYHLVVVGTDSITTSLSLNRALAKFDPNGTSREVAVQLASRLSTADSSRAWWGLGMPWHARKPK